MARNLQTKLIRAQLADLFRLVRGSPDLAGERWPEVADQCATLDAVWGGGDPRAGPSHGEPDLAAESRGLNSAEGPRRSLRDCDPLVQTAPIAQHNRGPVSSNPSLRIGPALPNPSQPPSSLTSKRSARAP